MGSERRRNVLEGLAAMGLVVGVFVIIVGGLLYLKGRYGRNPAELPLKDRISPTVYYLQDHASGLCFALTWVKDDNGKRFYMLANVPCTDRLPVATPTNKEAYL